MLLDGTEKQVLWTSFRSASSQEQDAGAAKTRPCKSEKPVVSAASSVLLCQEII